MKGNKIFDFSRKGFQDIINIMTKKINECVDVSNGLIPRLDDYISKVDWNKIINSDLYQNVIRELGKTNEQLETIENKVIYREKKTIHKKGTPNQYNLSYVALSGGVMYQGKETFCTRYGTGDAENQDKTKWGKLVLQIKEPNGEFNFIDLTDKLPNDYGWRDPNLTVDPSGNYLILKAIGSINYGTWTKWTNAIFIFDKDLNLIKKYDRIRQCGGEANASLQEASYGNLLFTPQGYILLTTFTGNGVIRLVKSKNNDLFNLSDVGDGSDFLVYTLLSDQTTKPNEMTICYWGNKLIGLIRTATTKAIYCEFLSNEGSNLYNWTYLPIAIDCPCLLCYNDEFEDLIFSGSILKTIGNHATRQIAIGVIPYNPFQYYNANTNEIDYELYYRFLEGEETYNGGGYPAMIKTSSGYSLIYYIPNLYGPYNGLYYVEIDTIDLNKVKNKNSYNIFQRKYCYLDGFLAEGNVYKDDKETSDNLLIYLYIKNSFTSNNFFISFKSTNDSKLQLQIKSGETIVATSSLIDVVNTNNSIKIQRIPLSFNFQGGNNYSLRVTKASDLKLVYSLLGALECDNYIITYIKNESTNEIYKLGNTSLAIN